MTKRVLVVEDEADLRLLWRTLLEADGYEAIEASTGLSALNLTRSERPDLILLDGHLPDGSGWEVLDEIAGDELLRTIPVIIVTGETGMDGQARERGAAGALTKPVGVKDLRDTVRAILARTTIRD